MPFSIQKLSQERANTGRAYLGHSLAIKDKRMEQLRTRHRHQQPAREPPRPVPEPPFLVQRIEHKLHRPRPRIDSRRNTKLRLRTDAQRETGHTCPDGGGISRCQCPGDAWVALAEGPRVIRAKIRAKLDEKAIEETVEEDDKGEREGETEVGGVQDRGAGFRPSIEAKHQG